MKTGKHREKEILRQTKTYRDMEVGRKGYIEKRKYGVKQIRWEEINPGQENIETRKYRNKHILTQGYIKARKY